MEKKRRARAIGEKLLLGETEYCIEGIEGRGGSAIVYQASYRDGLNHDSIHKVLIKELFPFHPRGLIYRDAEGRICCDAKAEQWMKRCRHSFYLGNQANLDLLGQMPEQVSGNLNSYEAYGTYYSVLPVHGGENLQTILEEGKGFQNLREIADVILKILDALKCFHDKEMLHLDISPDNIQILPTHALLIDYNSVWTMQRKPGDVCYFSEKKGYSAPEIILREEDEIGPAADIYSVSAVFFRMLTGSSLSEDAAAMGSNKCSVEKLGAFQDEPVSAVNKAVQIVNRGLHVLARKRYQSVSEMQKEIKELICRIDGKGVSFCTLFEGSRKEQKKQIKGEPYVPRRIRAEDGRIFSEEECYKEVCNGSCILLQGAGGMGKTQFLKRLWEMGVMAYQDSCPIPVYIPLADYQGAQEEPDYIRKWMLRHFCFSEQTNTMEDALHVLNHLFERAAQFNRTFVLFLDGLNEADARKRNLIKEIEELSRIEGVGILVTDRTDSVKRYGLHKFQTAEILAFTKKEVREYLTKYDMPLPIQIGLMELLTNPMMLVLYRKAFGLAEENGQEVKEEVSLQGIEDMIGFYLESLYLQELRRDSGDKEQQLLHSYLLMNLLPGIAWGMKSRKKTLFSLEELYELVRKDYHIMQGRGFAMAFPEYMGKTRLMLQGIRNEREWFDYAISEQLIERLNLMERNSEGSYRLIHDNFINYLARQARENQNKLRRYRVKSWIRTWGMKTGVGILAAAVIAVIGLSVWKKRISVQLSQEEQGIVYSAMQRMEINIGICNAQLQGQNHILKKASEQGVLEGNPESEQQLLELIERIMEEADSSYDSYRVGDEHLDNLENMGKTIPIEIVEELYHKPEELRKITEHAAGLLKARLCDENSIYDTYDKRKQLVETYQQYVYAYIQMCGTQYSQILYSLQEIDAEQAVDEMMGAAAELLLVGEYIHSYNSQAQADDAVTKAERKLSKARQAMKRQNLYYEQEQ